MFFLAVSLVAYTVWETKPVFNRKKYKLSLLPLAVFQRDTMECAEGPIISHVISHMILEL